MQTKRQKINKNKHKKKSCGWMPAHYFSVWVFCGYLLVQEGKKPNYLFKCLEK